MDPKSEVTRMVIFPSADPRAQASPDKSGDRRLCGRECTHETKEIGDTHTQDIKHFFSCLLFYILFMSGTPLEFTKTSKGSKVTPNGTWERFDPLKRYFTPWWRPMKLTTELSKKIKKKKRKKNETLSSKMRIHYSSVSGSILPLTQRKVKSEPRLRLNNNKITTKWWHKRPGEGVIKSYLIFSLTDCILV